MGRHVKSVSGVVTSSSGCAEGIQGENGEEQEEAEEEEEESDESVTISRRSTRSSKYIQVDKPVNKQQARKVRGVKQSSTNDAKPREKKPECTPVVKCNRSSRRKKRKSGKKGRPKSAAKVTAPSPVTTSSEQQLEVEKEPQLFDCCFIKVTGEVYNRWKKVRTELNLKHDEDLVVYFLNRYVSQTPTLKPCSPRPPPVPPQNELAQPTSEEKKEEIKSDDTEDKVASDEEGNTAQEPLKEEIIKTGKEIKSVVPPPEPCCADSEKAIIKLTKTGRSIQKRCRKPFMHDEDVFDDEDPYIGELAYEEEEYEEEDPSEKILKRKKISRYDCRKTPTDGIPGGSVCAVNGDDSLSQLQEGIKKDCLPSPPFALAENWCRNCDRKHEDKSACPLLKPSCIVTDSVIDFSAKDASAESSADTLDASRCSSSLPPSRLDLSKSFAQLSLPSPLALQERDPVHGLSVVVRTPVRVCSQFGPLQGETILERDIPDDFLMKDLWQIFTQDGSRRFVSTVNPEKSNWLRYIRPAPTRRQRNVAAVVKEDRLYFVTVKDLGPSDEILYWTDDPDLMWTKKRAEKKNCGGCNLRFTHPLYYRLHCTVFHDPQFSLTIRKYHCKVCGLAVLGKENIVRHASAQHDGKGAYQCQYCKKYFLRLNYLEMHRTYGCSSNPGRTRPLCDLCGKKFCQPQKLKVHMKRMHSDSTTEAMADFQCPICGKILGTRHAAQRHRKEVHSELSGVSKGSLVATHKGEEAQEESRLSGGFGKARACLPTRVACKKCGKSFKNKSNLKIHMLTHSGVKPFECKIEGCKQGFTTKQCLQFHYKKSHGYNDEDMPKIEREIPYTLTAYSGGLVSDPESPMYASSGDEDTEDGIHDGDKQTTLSNRLQNQGVEAFPKPQQDVEAGSVKDVYTFAEDEDKGIAEDKCNKAVVNSNTDEGSKVGGTEAPGLPSTLQMSATDRTSLLVAAALCAAEQDMKPDNHSSDSSEPPAAVDYPPPPNEVPIRDLARSPVPPYTQTVTEDVIPSNNRPSSQSHNIANIMSDSGFPETTYNLSEAVATNRSASDQPLAPQSSVATASYNGYLEMAAAAVAQQHHQQQQQEQEQQQRRLSRDQISPRGSSSGSSTYFSPADLSSFPYHAHHPHPSLDHLASRYGAAAASSFRAPPPGPEFAYNSRGHHTDFHDSLYNGGGTPSSASSIDLSSTGANDVVIPHPPPPPPPPHSGRPSSSLFSHPSSMINEHLLTVTTAGPVDPDSSSAAVAAAAAVAAVASRAIPAHQVSPKDMTGGGMAYPQPHNYPVYPHQRFPGSHSPYHPTPSHSRLPHISPGPSPYHHYGYF